jgi:hypothetical protein
MVSANLILTNFVSTPSKPQIGKSLTINANAANVGTDSTKAVFVAAVRFDEQGDGIWDVAEVVSMPALGPNMSNQIRFKKSFTPRSTSAIVQVCLDDTALPLTGSLPTPIPGYTPGQLVETTKADNCETLVLTPTAKGAGGAAAILGVTLDDNKALFVILALIMTTIALSWAMRQMTKD